MEQKETNGVLALGTPAPNFHLASAHGPEIVLEDYRGQRNVVLWFSQGLYCPFCRRHMAQLRLGYQEFQKRDTEVLQITYSTPEAARLYFQQYQLLFPYLCDPERGVYRLYGVPVLERGLFERIKTVATSMTVEMSDRLLHGERSASAAPYLKRYGSAVPEQALLIVDKSGIIRYVHTTRPIGGLPSNAEYFRQLEKLQ